MQNYKPWLTVHDNNCLPYYPSAKPNYNCYAIFSPSVDRFLIVDNLCPWMILKTAEILSSKISTVTYILNPEISIEIDNSNCLYYSTEHKKGEPTLGGAGQNSHKQSASMAHINNTKVIFKGWSEEFKEKNRKKFLSELQEYALFVLRCVHSIKIADSFRNTFPESHYLKNYFENEHPDEFTKYFDGTVSSKGMYNEITNILYHSKNTVDAINNINEVWKKYSKFEITGMRELFYNCSGIEKPNFGFDAKEVINNYTLWAV